jgi:hypothetical protein
MNHDCAHCLDWDRTCPEDCFRAKVTADLESPNTRTRLLGIPLTWSSFAGTPECKRCGGDSPTEDLSAQYRKMREQNEFLRGYKAGYAQGVIDSQQNCDTMRKEGESP